MDNFVGVGVSIPRKESFDKVTGTVKYTDDTIEPNILHAKILTSPHAHAAIKAIDTTQASSVPGVKAVITGDHITVLCGTVLEDRHPIARGKVRYFGEPVAVVVANNEHEAMKAMKLIKVQYEQLPVINSVHSAIAANSPLVHENLYQYTHAVEDVYNTGYEILAYISLSKDRAQNGNPLILVANNLEEQKQLTMDIAKALRAEIVQLTCGDYMVISKG